MNLYGFLTFGKSIESILNKNQMSLGIFCIMAGIFTNAFFVVFNPSGSCIGLSGVALSLFSMDAKFHPSKQIAFWLRFLPIQLPAQYALTMLLFGSIAGMTLSQGRDGIAHAAHLGGILFGMIAYELIKRGHWMYWKRKFHSVLLRNKKQNNRRKHSFM